MIAERPNLEQQRIVRAAAPAVLGRGTPQDPQPQTTTDAAGVFQFAGLTAGQLTLRFVRRPPIPQR